MIDTKVELYKYKPISDGYGGANLVPVPVRKLNGKFIPKTSIKEVVDAKNGFKIQAKFICETKVRPEEGHLINCDGTMYGITGIKDIYSKGSVLELVVNG